MQATFRINYFIVMSFMAAVIWLLANFNLACADTSMTYNIGVDQSKESFDANDNGTITHSNELDTQFKVGVGLRNEQALSEKFAIEGEVNGSWRPGSTAKKFENDIHSKVRTSSNEFTVDAKLGAVFNISNKIAAVGGLKVSTATSPAIYAGARYKFASKSSMGLEYSHSLQNEKEVRVSFSNPI